MPIYEYCCTKCKHVFEEWIKHFDALEDIHCPLCNSVAQRIVSNTSFILKGGGWYVTEYGNQKKSDSQKSSESKMDNNSQSTGVSGTVKKDVKSEKNTVSKDTQKTSVAKIESKSAPTSTAT